MTARAPVGALRARSGDLALGLALAAAAAAAAWYVTGLQDHIQTLNNPSADDVWFEGDPIRVFRNMTERGGNHNRSNVHPLFSLITLAYSYLCSALLNLNPLQAVRVSIASAAAVWLASFYLLLRLLGCQKPDATLFSLVAASSAAALFWTAIPETYLLGSLTVIGVLIVAACAERAPVKPWLDVAMAAGALSITVTNWMAALASLIVRHRLPRAVQLASNSFVVVVLLMGLQKLLVPSSIFLFDIASEHKALVPPEPLTTLKVFLLHTMVMPDVQAVPQKLATLWPLLSVQRSATWHLTPWGPVALCAWVLLLGFGTWTAFTMQRLGRFRLVVLLTLAGQYALHLVYGSETFLYALDWLPLLVLTAALGTSTRLRPLVLVVAAVFVVAGLLHNYAEFRFTLAALGQVAPPG